MNTLRNILAFCLLLFSSMTIAQDPPVADGIQYPVPDTWVVSGGGGCDYFATACANPGFHHLAEDMYLPEWTPIYAPVDCIVKQARSSGGYGGLFLGEAQINGETFVVLLGHNKDTKWTIRKSFAGNETNQELKRGDLIGYIAKRDENGGDYAPHTHFGIHKGSYDAHKNLNKGLGPSLDSNGNNKPAWAFAGYAKPVPDSDPLVVETRRADLQDDWHDPSDFITAHPIPAGTERWHDVGSYASGWSDGGTHDQDWSHLFLDKYTESAIAGHPLGDPVDNDSRENEGTLLVHEWYGMWIQDYFNDGNGYDHPRTAIILSPAPLAFLLKEGFYDYYMARDRAPVLLRPTSDEENWHFAAEQKDVTRQTFEGGYLIYDGTVREFTNAGVEVTQHVVTVYSEAGVGGTVYLAGKRVSGNVLPVTDSYPEGTYDFTFVESSGVETDFTATINGPFSIDVDAYLSPSNLEVTSHTTANGNPDIGETVTMTATITNFDNTTAVIPQIKVSVQDGSFGEYQQRIVVDQSVTLTQNQTHTFTYDVTFLEPDGDRSLFLLWDSPEGFRNFLQTPLHLTVGDPSVGEDGWLAVTDISFSPAIMYADETFDLEVEFTEQIGSQAYYDKMWYEFRDASDNTFVTQNLDTPSPICNNGYATNNETWPDISLPAGQYILTVKGRKQGSQWWKTLIGGGVANPHTFTVNDPLNPGTIIINNLVGSRNHAVVGEFMTATFDITNTDDDSIRIEHLGIRSHHSNGAGLARYYGFGREDLAPGETRNYTSGTWITYSGTEGNNTLEVYVSFDRYNTDDADPLYDYDGNRVTYPYLVTTSPITAPLIEEKLDSTWRFENFYFGGSDVGMWGADSFLSERILYPSHTLDGDFIENIYMELTPTTHGNIWDAAVYEFIEIVDSTQYVIEFKARSDDVGRLIHVMVVGDAASGWANRGVNTAVPLCNQWTKVTIPWVANATDSTAQFLLEFGDDSTAIEIDNVTLRIYTEPVILDNLITGGGFERDNYREEGWDWHYGGSAVSSANIITDSEAPEGEKVAEYVVDPAGADIWNAVQYATNIPASQDTSYQVEVWMKSSLPTQDVYIIYTDSAGSWPHAGLEQWVTIDSTWKQYTLAFTCTTAQTNGNLYIETGSTASTLWLDNVSMYKAPTLVKRAVEPQVVPDGFALYQNYPNPFNPITTIAFDMPQTTAVSVTIYNVLGQEVKKLLDDQKLSSGRHEIRWNGRNEHGVRVATGVYFYHFKSDAFSETKPMILMK